MKQQTNPNLTDRLEKHPMLKARFEAILDVAENTNGDLISADEAEQRAIEQVRLLGNELLHDWAEQRGQAAVETFKTQEKTAVGHGKKK